MSSTEDIDACILPYTRNNDPLPTRLQPILDTQLKAVTKHVSAWDARISETERQILERQQRIRALEEEIENFRRVKVLQTETRDGYIGTIQTLASTVSIVRRLPPEIITSIILLSILGDAHSERHLINICSVSRLWRSTAISTPSLWRSPVVELDNFSRGRSHNEARMLFTSHLDAWFSRGGEGAAIRVFFSRRDALATGPESLIAQDVLDWLRGCPFNINVLGIGGLFVKPNELQDFFSTSAPSFHSTTHLTLRLPSSSSPGAPLIDIGSILPSLDTLSLAGDARSFSVQFAHSKIATVELFSLDLRPRDIVQLAKSLPALQNLALFGCTHHDDDNEDDINGEGQEPFTHPSIRQIHFTGTFFGELLGRLICPALERLYLDPDSRTEGSSSLGVSQPSAQALGELAQHCDASNVALLIAEQLPNTFVNTLLSASRRRITSVSIPSLAALQLDSSPYGTCLTLPSSITSVRCYQCVDEEEANVWLKKLAMCVEDHSQVVRVKFGEGKDVIVKHLEPLTP
ncbi:hypothetical protein BKA70DRAFT_1479607 [Coprinopsis sp. MPI-PUGE-AT-0042]|nr:hypothetical protein BKA70DRAFT_1479607 [Coprinopsis sp. MPI-PUGE-AT-0042]